MHGYLANLLAPHYCCSCGEIGALLCDRCKYYIVSEPYESCLLCHNVAKPTENLCNSCLPTYSHAWVVGSRTDVLKKAIDDYKFERTRAAYKLFAELFDATLPNLPSDVIVVPIPTIAKHVRMRGYDHMRLIARQLARMRTLTYSPCLYRATATMQRGANRALRREQAEMAFAVRNIRKGARYLIVDDISTTGATLEYASRTLLQAGAAEVWVAVLAAQPLEKSLDI